MPRPTTIALMLSTSLVLLFAATDGTLAGLTLWLLLRPGREDGP